MPTSYHRSVQAALITIGRANRRRFRRVLSGDDRRPLHIVHPWSRETLLYSPDARYETRSGKLWLFEVMDTETGSQAQMIAHVIEPLFVLNVLKVVHVVKSLDELRELERVTNVIMSNLTDLAGRRVDARIRYYRVVVRETDAASTDSVRQILREGGLAV